MEAEVLRELVRGLLPWLDDKTYSMVTVEILDRAARSRRDWTRTLPPMKVSPRFRSSPRWRSVGATPTLRKWTAIYGRERMLSSPRTIARPFKIFHALVIPLSECKIDIGQLEMCDEVLGVDVADCAAQYVVATYMTTAPAHRVKAVKTAIDDMCAAEHFWHPLDRIEQMARDAMTGTPMPTIGAGRWRSVSKAPTVWLPSRDRRTVRAISAPGAKP